MEDPQYIVLCALDTPSRDTGIYISGGVMAAPTVGAVMEDILPYLGVPRVYGPEEAQSRQIPLEDFRGADPAGAQKRLRELGLEGTLRGRGERVLDQLPAPGQIVPGGSQVILYLSGSAPDTPVTVPDLAGLDRREAAEAAGELGLGIIIKGNNTVAPHVVAAAQNIPAGTQVPPGTALVVEFIDRQARD